MPRSWLTAPLLALFLVAAACTSSTPTSTGASASGGPQEGTGGDLTLMTFNVEYGGKLISFDAVLEAIETSGAQVVGINEAEGNVAEIAEELGWPYHDSRRAIVSRLPLLSPPDEEAAYTFVELEPGSVAAVANVHLTSSPYGPNLISNKDYELDKLLATEEKVRVSEIDPIIESMATLPDTTPRFVIGDMNSPSHHDYTEETVGERPQIEYPVEWPVTLALEGSGYGDSFRSLHPDPVSDPGLTWPAWRPEVEKGYNPPDDANEDRIDYIFGAGPVEPVDSWVMGEEGGPGVAKSVTPWPTDHRALITTYALTGAPAPPPVLVSVSNPLVPIGSELKATFHAPGEEGEQIVVLGMEDGAAQPPEPIASAETQGETDGVVTFDTTGWTDREHAIQLRSANGEVLASTNIWLQAPDAGPQIVTDRTSYKVGEPILAAWYGAPANRWDWVGIYDRGANPNVAYYKTWAYTEATVAGEAELSGKANGKWPLEPGKYSVYLLIDDGYQKVAESNFVVKGK